MPNLEGDSLQDETVLSANDAASTVHWGREFQARKKVRRANFRCFGFCLWELACLLLLLVSSMISDLRSGSCPPRGQSWSS